MIKSTYDEERELQDETVYWYQNMKRYGITDGALVEKMGGVTGWGFDKVSLLTPNELNEVPIAKPVFIVDVKDLPNSEDLLVKEPNDQTVYVMRGGKLRPIADPDAFHSQGFEFDDVLDVSREIICQFEHGPEISSQQSGRIRGYVVYDRGDSREDVRRPDLLNCVGFPIPRILVRILGPAVGLPELLGINFCGSADEPGYCESSNQELRLRNIAADRPIFDSGLLPVGTYELDLQLPTEYQVIDGPALVVIRDGETTEVGFVIADAAGDDPPPNELHLAISSTEFCLGDLRGIVVENGAANSAVFLSAWKNGKIFMADQKIAQTDQSGKWSEARVLQGDGLIGSWWTQVRVGTVHSNLVSFSIFDCSENPTPVLVLDRAEYCVGEESRITVRAKPNSSIDLHGVSGGVSWSIPDWNRTNEDGFHQGTKEMFVSDLGTFSLWVEVAGRISATTSFTVRRCAIPKPNIVEITPDPVRPDREVFLAVKGENFQPNFRAEVLVGQNTFPIKSDGLQFVSTDHVNVSVKMAGQLNPYSAALRISNSDGQMALRSFGVDANEEGEDFSLIVVPPNRTIRKGDDTTVRVKVESINSFDDSVSLSLSGLPTGTSPGTGFSERILRPAPNGSAETTLAILTNDSTRSGFTPVIVLGNTASTTKSAALELTILDEDPPAISSIEPDPVEPDTQTLLTVDGSGFKAEFSAEVFVGGTRFPISPEGLIFLSSSRVLVSVFMLGQPDAYVATLRITNPDQQSATSLFTVGEAPDTALSISSVTPDPVPPEIQTWLTVRGSGFQVGFVADVIVDGTTNTISPNGLEFRSPSQVRVSVRMLGRSNRYDATLRITNPDGHSASTAFTVEQRLVPVITSIDPTAIEPSTFTLTINGTNFDDQASDRIFWKATGDFVGSGVDSGDLISRSPNRLVVRERMDQADPGTYTVKVRNSDGQLSDGKDFTLTSTDLLPGAVSVNPPSGNWTTSPQNVQVNSAEADHIWYKLSSTTNGNTPTDPPLPSPSLNDGRILGASGIFPVFAEAGQFKRLKVRFRGENSTGLGPTSNVHSYSIDLRQNAPQITNISPTSIEQGTFTLTINGENFDSQGASDRIFWKATGAFVGSGVDSGDLISRSTTRLVVRERMDQADPGTYTVKVRNPDGQLSNGFDFELTQPPVTLSMSPSSGPQGTIFNFSGSGYTPNCWALD